MLLFLMLWRTLSALLVFMVVAAIAVGAGLIHEDVALPYIALGMACAAFARSVGSDFQPTQETQDDEPNG